MKTVSTTIALLLLAVIPTNAAETETFYQDGIEYSLGENDAVVTGSSNNIVESPAIIQVHEKEYTVR